jgi:D-glycerate 3-kinase
VNGEQLPALLSSLIAAQRARRPERPAVLGVAGAQGSGKTTLCQRFARDNPLVAHFSLDDVYFSRKDREELARLAHPLFITRGPPGTHNLELALGTLVRLIAGASGTPLPRFDKLRDEDVPFEQWPRFPVEPETVLVDGWCIGALAPPEGPPLNAIERVDSDGLWRAAQSTMLEGDYAAFFERFDAIIYLQAPNWEIVRRWRGQQEAAALGRPLSRQEELALDRFVMHYERITRAMLDGCHRAGWIVYLDENRNVTRIEQRP